MLSSALVSAILAVPALAVDVAFMKGEACSGQPLYGMKGLEAVTCYDITDDVVPASVDLRNLAKNQKVRLFADTACTQELHSTTSRTCYSVDGANIAAFTVSNATEPAIVEREAAAVDGMSKELVEYGVKLSDYKGLEAAPFSTNIRYSNFFIGALALATASGLSFTAGVVGCYSAATSGGALSIFGCVAGPISTILSYVGYHFLARAGQTVTDALELAQGTIHSGYHRRQAIDDANFAFMHSAMNVTGSEAVHTGKLMRRTFSTGDHVSPIYELTGGDGVRYHFTAFYDDETGDFMHHMAPEDSVQFDKRAGPGYNNVRWSSGGMDFSFCNYNSGASRQVFKNRSLQQLYNTAYQDLSCLVSQNDFKNNQQLLVDMYNGNSQLVGETNIAPYKQGGPVNNNRYVINRCSSRKGTINQSCIN